MSPLVMRQSHMRVKRTRGTQHDVRQATKQRAELNVDRKQGARRLTCRQRQDCHTQVRALSKSEGGCDSVDKVQQPWSRTFDQYAMLMELLGGGTWPCLAELTPPVRNECFHSASCKCVAANNGHAPQAVDCLRDGQSVVAPQPPAWRV